jgi:hypothetical protein
VDVLSTLLELSEKLFNSCEPERKPSRKQSVRKSMIYTGDEDYKKYYKKDSDEKDKKGNEDNNNNKTHQRRLSSMGYISIARDTSIRKSRLEEMKNKIENENKEKEKENENENENKKKKMKKKKMLNWKIKMKIMKIKMKSQNLNKYMMKIIILL